jgi:hypothetical protein
MKYSLKNRALEGTRSGDVVGGYREPGKTFERFCFCKGCPMKNIDVSVQRKGNRVMVLAAGILSEPMIFEDGSWKVGVFTPDETEAFDFRRASAEESTRLFKEAKAALDAIKEGKL